MATLICGSVAYDNIMVFKDRFKDCILPDQIHILNVCFLVPDIKRVFGGCAGNIAYGLKLLGSDARIVATVGEDAASAERFINGTDSAATYVNVSTRFTDGGEFGLGCELGISTQKMHARGPMGLNELTSYKYIVRGQGQVRE